YTRGQQFSRLLPAPLCRGSALSQVADTFFLPESPAWGRTPEKLSSVSPGNPFLPSIRAPPLRSAFRHGPCAPPPTPTDTASRRNGIAESAERVRPGDRKSTRLNSSH